MLINHSIFRKSINLLSEFIHRKPCGAVFIHTIKHLFRLGRSYSSLAVIRYHDQKQLIRGRVHLDLTFQKDKRSSLQEGMEAGGHSRNLRDHTLNHRKINLRTGSEMTVNSQRPIRCFHSGLFLEHYLTAFLNQ